MKPSSSDLHYMRYALSLARRGLGRTAPNPSVGCVIVKNGRVIGAGRTADGGRPHAEPQALAMAGERARGATAYVTLEPCSHHGKTPPCAQSLIDAGIKRVVIACIDSFKDVDGKGVAMLQAAGIEVLTGVMEKEALALNAGFILSQTQNRPFVTIKTAISADGKVALEDGRSKWITSEHARHKAHQLRAQHDAILCGIGTVNHDDPLLTARVNGLVHKAVRIVVDSALTIPVASKLVQSSVNEPLWIAYASSEPAHETALQNAGARLLKVKSMDLQTILARLSEEGVRRLLVEGGPTLHSSFIRDGLYDEIAIFRAHKIIGRGLDAFSAFSLESLDDAPLLSLKESVRLGDDRLDIYERKPR